MSSFETFFKGATGFDPYPWQLEASKKILSMEKGVFLLRAETGSGKTEAVVLPGLYSGKQVLVVEPFRALVEDMEDRLSKLLERLSSIYGIPYSLALDYGGDTEITECIHGFCKEERTAKPFGADVYVTTMDELLYRLLSVAVERKASLYSGLIRMGTPLVFFDEMHSYADDAFNPFVTVMHEAVSLSLYAPVVLASATMPETVADHLKMLTRRNGLDVDEYSAPPMEKQYPKGMVKVDFVRGSGAISEHALSLLKKHGTVLVRTIVPETAYSVYTEIVKALKKEGLSANVGIIHGRMPTKDKARIFRSVREDMKKRAEKVILVSTPAIEAGVDLDFDSAVIELTPYRSLEQTIGRVNRYYKKGNAELVIVDVKEEHWVLLEDEEYLEDAREVLRAYSDKTVAWEQIRGYLKQLDDKYAKEKLSVAKLIDSYSSPYSRILYTSLRSLFHLEGTLLDHVIALGKDEYETRGDLDITAEVEGEPGNYLRIPVWMAEKIGLSEGERVPRSALKDHSYIRIENGSERVKVKAGGLIA